MPAKKKTNAKTKTTKAKRLKKGDQKSAKLTKKKRLNWWQRLMKRRANFLARRTHRSFRLTKRRDYIRSLNLPGYWSLTTSAFKTVAENKRIFIGLALIYALIALMFSGLMSQDVYQQLKDFTTGAEEDGWISGAVSTLSLFGGVVASYLSGTSIDPNQQTLAAIISLMVWLATIWLMRSILAGNKPKIRDGIYSAGAPIVAMVALVVIALIQLLPAAIGAIVYGALDATGALKETPTLMLAGGATILVVVLSLYWLTSTIFALVIVTLPGMYPLQALKMAGDIVLGRRIRILLRLMWLVFILAIFWLMILIPIILLDGAIKSAWEVIDWLPIVPISALILVSMSIVFSAVYIYLFYRKVVESDSQKS